MTAREPGAGSAYGVPCSAYDERMRMFHEGEHPDLMFRSMKEQDAMRLTLVGNLEIERRVDEFALLEEGDWTYSVEHDGDIPGLEGAYAMLVRYQGSSPDVRIPETLGGYEVRELFNSVFAGNASLESVYMPDTVLRMGFKTFAMCGRLASLRLSDSLEDVDPTTLSMCRSLKDVHLPAKLKVMRSRLLYDCPLEVLEVPACLEEIEEQAYSARHLKSVAVDEANTNFSTDGIALYNRDATVLVSVPVQVESLELAPSCRRVEYAACKGMTKLAAVDLRNVEEIGPYAFFRTSLTELVLPQTVRSIGTCAFYICSKLGTAQLNEGLESIGRQAFAQTKIRKVYLPESLRSIGPHVFERTGMEFGEGGGFNIAPGNPYLLSDGKALYQRIQGGLRFCSLLVAQEEYELLDGCCEVADGACEHERLLRRIMVPEGVTRIGEQAFKFCDALEEVLLPDTLERIGREAFWQTSLRSVYLGPKFEKLGQYALEVAGNTKEHENRTLRKIEVSPQNKRFSYRDNLLLEHGEHGDTVRVFVEPRDVIEIPPTVCEVAEMAFYHACAKELHVPSSVEKVSSRAFLGLDGLERVRISYAQQVDGFESVELVFPKHARDIEDFSRPLVMDEDGLFFDYATYDSMVVHEFDPVVVVDMVLARFEQPVKLKESDRTNFEAAIIGLLNAVVRRYAQTEDVERCRHLEQHGYLAGDALEMALRVARTEGSEKVTAYLESLRGE